MAVPSDVGNETKADTRGAGLDRTRSGIVGNATLAHAVEHLKAEHPHRYDDHGPHHHGSMTKHIPLHGMKPGGNI